MISDSISLLILSGVQGDPRRYRAFHLYEQALLAGLPCQIAHITDPDLKAKAKQSSVVIIHRAIFDKQVAWLEKEIHGKGGILIHDLDDLIFDPDMVTYIHSPDFSDHVRRDLYLEEVRLHRKTLDACDYVLTSGDYLTNLVRQLGKPAFVHRNAFSLEMLTCAERALSTRKSDPSKFIIGYASGTPTHDQDFALIKTALQTILSAQKNVELWLVGRINPGKDWGVLGKQIMRLPLISWRKLPEILIKFDVNLAPLVIENPFGQSKSEIKYMEAALVRVPTIASPSDSFKTAMRHGVTGLLANSVQEWQTCLETLVGHPETRNTLGRNSYREVLLNYHPRVRASQLVDILNQIFEEKYGLQSEKLSANLSGNRQHQPVWSCVELERSPGLIQRGLHTIRNRNFITLLKQVWIFFRRSVSPIFPF